MKRDPVLRDIAPNQRWMPCPECKRDDVVCERCRASIARAKERSKGVRRWHQIEMGV